MPADWHVVLTADGAVLAVTGGAPADWVGTRLAERQDLPDELRQRARSLLGELHGSLAPIAAATVSWPEGGGSIYVMAVEAIPLRRVVTNLGSLLESAIDTMRAQAAAIDVTLALHLDKTQPASLFLDPEKVAWAVTALVGNALRYVRHGSRRMPGGLISVRSEHDAGRSEVNITVEDDGPGIPQDKIAFLFERAPGRQLTAGLGLMMARDIVAAHGGRLSVESRTEAAGQGTAVRLTFPVI